MNKFQCLKGMAAKDIEKGLRTGSIKVWIEAKDENDHWQKQERVDDCDFASSRYDVMDMLNNENEPYDLSWIDDSESICVYYGGDEVIRLCAKKEVKQETRIDIIKKEVAMDDDVLEGLLDQTDLAKLTLVTAGALQFTAETKIGWSWRLVQKIDVKVPEEIHELIYAADMSEDYAPGALEDLAKEQGGKSDAWRTVIYYNGEKIGVVEASRFPWEN